MKGLIFMADDIDTEKDFVITITADDGHTADYTVLRVFTAGGRDYIALIPHDDNIAFKIELFRYSITSLDGMEGIELSTIISDMEYETAKHVFESLIEADTE